MNPDTIQTQNSGSEHDSVDRSKWSGAGVGVGWLLDSWCVKGF